MPSRVPFALLAAWLGLSGCATEGTPGASAAAECRSDLECPKGQVCDPFIFQCLRVPLIPGGDASAIDTRFSACPPGQGCDDGDPCTRADVCADGVCAGTPFDCDDGLDCTEDTCLGDDGCLHTPPAGQCLLGGACREAGAAHAEDPCRICRPEVSPVAWSDAEDGAACDDGLACTVEDACLAGRCRGTRDDLLCDDGDLCTDDLCTSSGCRHPASPTACDDGDACTLDACDAVAGCQHLALPCDDGDACTVDRCEPAAGCAHEAVDPCPPAGEPGG